MNPFRRINHAITEALRHAHGERLTDGSPEELAARAVLYQTAAEQVRRTAADIFCLPAETLLASHIADELVALATATKGGT